MSPIDILSRSLLKPADPQFLRDSTAANDAIGASGASSDADGFDTFLKGLSEHYPRDGENAQASQGQDPLDLIADPNPADAAGAGSSNAVFVLLEGLLPRVLPQPAPTGSAGDAQSCDDSPQEIPSGSQQLQAMDDLLKSAAPQRLTVAVQHQETHFKPIIEASVTDTNLKGEEETGSEAEAAAPGGKFTGEPSRTAHPRQQEITRSPLPQEAAPRVAKEQVERQILDKSQSSTVTLERLAARKNASEAMPQSEDSHLPPATLQRLASSVGNEIRSMINESAQNAALADRIPHALSIKASDSALRILNLQLHPADLGRVTIKMRLAGDNLEMELHTEREETAQLLRNDSEKLSALLRGAGYRPDAITIQVSGTAEQDRVSAQRQQSNMEFQGQSFQEGGASQEGHSRNQESQYASTRTEPPRNQTEDPALVSRNTDALYL